ncbi:MAG: HupE / UreJ protein [Pseudomonadota bacterium]|jgi:urease accessory protein
MKSRVLSVALATALLFPVTAFAHVGPDGGAHGGDHGAGGLLAGLIHPLGGLDHLLAMVAVGLLAVRLGSRGGRAGGSSSCPPCSWAACWPVVPPVSPA